MRVTKSNYKLTKARMEKNTQPSRTEPDHDRSIEELYYLMAKGDDVSDYIRNKTYYAGDHNDADMLKLTFEDPVDREAYLRGLRAQAERTLAIIQENNKPFEEDIAYRDKDSKKLITKEEWKQQNPYPPQQPNETKSGD